MENKLIDQCYIWHGARLLIRQVVKTMRIQLKTAHIIVTKGPLASQAGRKLIVSGDSSFGTCY